MKKRDLIPGFKIAKWTVISKPFFKKISKGIFSKKEFIQLKCDCGTIAERYLENVAYGKSTQCRECSQDYMRTGYKDISGTRFCHIKTSAKKRGYLFEITPKDIYDLWIRQDKKCKLSGIPVTYQKRYDLKDTASVDRIDSSKGYTLENIQIVHKDINMMKNTYSQEYFIEMCINVTKANYLLNI